MLFRSLYGRDGETVTVGSQDEEAVRAKEGYQTAAQFYSYPPDANATFTELVSETVCELKEIPKKKSK